MTPALAFILGALSAWLVAALAILATLVGFVSSDLERFRAWLDRGMPA